MADHQRRRVILQSHQGDPQWVQGAARPLDVDEKETYLSHSTRNAQLLDGDYEIIVVHDPQPLALLQMHRGNAAKWIWRCHIDTSEPNMDIWQFLQPYLRGYDAAVFTLGGFVPPALPVDRVEIIPPAIDPARP